MSSAKIFATNSAEMSKKLRAAIKAKLEELGVYVDEELPDYIMVMIANRKEKVQMKEDLLLFLGKNTNKFVDWLFEIFERLQSAGAALPTDPTGTQQVKKKDQSVILKKEKSKEEEPEKKHIKKEREVETKRIEVKEPEKHKEREKEHEKEERKEREKREAKVVKSKPPPHHRTSSASPSREKNRIRRKSEAKPEAKERDGGYRSERKMTGTSIEKPLNKDNKSRLDEQKAAGTSSRRKYSDEGSAPRRHVEERITRRSPVRIQSRTSGRVNAEDESEPSHSNVRRKKDLTVLRPLDSDEEERIAEEVSRQELTSKKVLSSAVLKMKQSEPVKTVSSKIVVKRKLPEKENTKNARGAQSLFLKAIKEAGRMTRTASQIAGYGGGATTNKKGVEKTAKQVEEEEASEPQEEGIEIDDDIDMEDALVVMTSSAASDGERRRVEGRSVLSSKHDSEKPVTSKQAGIESESAGVSNPKFFVTLKNADVGESSHSTGAKEDGSLSERSRKRRSGGEKAAGGEVEEAGKRTAVKPKKIRKSDLLVRARVGSDADSEELRMQESPVTCEASNESRRSSTWDRQIPLEEDSSDDDEAQIDAVLASAQTITVVGLDEEVPPTPTLTASAFSVGDGDYFAQRQNIAVQARNSPTATDAVPVITPGEKIMERCKFWPNCRLEESCIYIHPSKPCSNFPGCKFGDRCIYLHPACKFDHHCTNPHCPYSHTPKSSAVTTSAPAVVMPSPAPAPTVAPPIAAPLNASIACKFGGRCTNPSCTYKHPKLCRFGDRCTNRNCYFRHINMVATSTMKSATFDKYKWKATVPA